jgi:hypothetical protein
VTISEYLGRESAKEREMMTRFTCGNEERKQALDGRRRKKVQNVPWGEKQLSGMDVANQGEGEKGTGRNTE